MGGGIPSPPPSLTMEPQDAQQLSAAHPEQLQASQQRLPPMGGQTRLVLSEQLRVSQLKLSPRHFCTGPSATQGLCCCRRHNPLGSWAVPLPPAPAWFLGAATAANGPEAAVQTRSPSGSDSGHAATAGTGVPCVAPRWCRHHAQSGSQAVLPPLPDQVWLPASSNCQR